MHLRRVCALLLLAASLSAPVAARAQSREPVRQKVVAAKAQYNLRNYLEAARLYTEAWQLAPKTDPKTPDLVLAVALAYRKHWEEAQSPESLRRAIEFFQIFTRDTPARAGEVAEALEALAAARTQLDSEVAHARSAVGPALAGAAERLLSRHLVPEAAEIVARLLAERGSPRQVVLSANALQARVLGAIGDVPAAVQSWKIVLALEPAFPPPAALEEAARRAFDQARASAPPPLGAVVDEGALVLTDALGLVRAVTLRCSAGEAPAVERRVEPSARIDLAGGAKAAACTARLLGAADGVLLELGSEREPLRAVSPKPAPVTLAVPPPAPQAGGRKARAGLSAPTLVALGVGAAGLATALVTYPLALGKKGDLDRDCPMGTCRTSTAKDALSGYEALRTTTFVALGAGIAGALAGGALYWLGERADTGTHAWIGPTGAGIAGTF